MPAGQFRDPLWETEKFVSWPYSLANPVVRLPTPSGRPTSKSIRPLPGEHAAALFARCLAYRDKEGVRIWGEKRWLELLRVCARSVARHREQPAGQVTGVKHYIHNGTRLWRAGWYELRPDGRRVKRTKDFSYGKPTSQFMSSEAAKQAAIDRRMIEEARWYSTLGKGEDRVASKLD